MDDLLLEMLKTIDPALLTEVVRKARRDPHLKIQDWIVEPLGVGGSGLCVFRLSGTYAGQPWAVVAKHFERPAEEEGSGDANSDWKKEILLSESGVLDQLPSGMRAPRFYGSHQGLKDGWLWMEYLEEIVPKRWTLEIFQRTACQLGRFNAAYLSGTPIPTQPWLRQNFFRHMWADDWLCQLMSPTTDDSVWNSPDVRSMFTNTQKACILRLIDERKLFFNANDHLPQVFCHNDAQRRNFFWVGSSHAAENDLAVIDWEICGLGALGNDLGQLIGSSMFLFEYSPYEAETLEAALLESYMAGVSDQKIKVDPRFVRLGYLISISVGLGMNMPGLVFFHLPSDSIGIVPLFGHTREELLPGWVQLNAFVLDRADEARSLIRQLRL